MAAPEIALGIDLGTSFSTAAAWVNGKMYLVPDSRGEPCIPSVVYFPAEGAPVVGAYADKMRKLEPANTVAGIKRILGKGIDSGEVRILDAHSAVKIAGSSSGLPVLQTRRGDYTAAQVATIIFRHLKELAEARFRLPVRRCAITVPAAASPETELATIHAAQAAGLEVLRTVSEPSAAAFAHDLDAFRGSRSLLVYDFGGGTFDVTLLRQQGSSLEPVAVAGDSCLGGDDLDHALAQLVASFVWSVHRHDVTRDAERWDRIVRECERTKRALSARLSAPLRVPDAFAVKGQSRALELELTRSEVEPRWEALVRRSLQVTAELMMKAGLRPEKLDAALLVGGTTYVPMVRAALGRMLGKPGIHEGDPQTSVARGAAILAARSLAKAA